MYDVAFDCDYEFFALSALSHAFDAEMRKKFGQSRD